MLTSLTFVFFVIVWRPPRSKRTDPLLSSTTLFRADSERGIVWCCSDSLSLREFLRLSSRDKVPDHSWLSKTRCRLPHEVHDQIFGWVLALVAGHDLVKGERIGVDGSTMEANAALRKIGRAHV